MSMLNDFSEPGALEAALSSNLQRDSKGRTADWVVERIEDLITEIVDRDGMTYERALERVEEAIKAVGGMDAKKEGY